MKGERRGSALIIVLCFFVIISTFALIIFRLSMGNTNQAKIQEEDMRAYYLAYSGCEMAYAALVQAASGQKWEKYVSSFGTEMKTLKKADLDILGDKDEIVIQVEKAPDSSGFKGWLQIAASATSNKDSRFAGEKVKYLYVNPKDHLKLFWK